MVHVPVHASWLNQIEIVFSILQRKVLTPNELTDTDTISERIASFEQRFNAKAHPYNRHFTRSDLELFLKKLATHEDMHSERAAA